MTNSDPTPTYTVRVRAEVDCLAYLRLVLRRTLPQLDETTDALFYGAVTEIVSNAITAQASSAPDRAVSVNVYRRPHAAIEIVDTGAGFDPYDPPSSAGGFGLQIAQSVCPEMIIDSSAHGTSVTLPYPASVT